MFCCGSVSGSILVLASLINRPAQVAPFVAKADSEQYVRGSAVDGRGSCSGFSPPGASQLPAVADHHLWGPGSSWGELVRSLRVAG